MIQPIISQRGPLPIEVPFDYQGDGSVGFYIAGSAWTNNGGQAIGVQILLDGNSLGYITVFANEATSHKTLIPKLIPVKIGMGEHRLRLVAWEGTLSDNNDYFVVQIVD
jgi:hypothetical protein